jgi:serine/threonine-protein kinase
MSPEQSSGDVVGPTADLYSLGCMLYEMLAGEPPFTAKSAMALMARHAMESVPSIRIVRQTVPEEVEDAIFAAMAKVPADRPQTAAAFSEMLGLGLGMGTTTARRAAIRATATRRVPTGANVQYAPVEAPWYKKPWAIAAAAVVVVGAALATWRFGFAGASQSAGIAPRLDPHSVAVLYFEDQSRDQSLGYVAEGLTDGLIKALAQVQGLRVVSKGGSNAWRGSDARADSIANALNVGTLVRGSVEQEGDKLRVNVRLVDGNSGADIDRAAIEQPAQDVLEVQDAVAEQVATLIRKQLGEEIKLQELRSGTRNTQAWSLVQQAEQLRQRGEAAAAQRDTVAVEREFGAADSLLTLAESADAQWSEPAVQRAFLAYRRSRLAGLDRGAIDRWVNVGMGHVDRALKLDPSDPDALEIRGNLQYWFYLMGLQPDPAKGNELLLAAKKDLEEATRINPTQAGAHASLSHLYYRTGNAVDVYTAARAAYQADAFLDNAGQILNRLFTSAYDIEQFTDARFWCDETARRFPASAEVPRCELFLLTTKRDTAANIDLAWKMADSMAALTPGARQEQTRLRAHTMVGVVIARAGLADSARSVVERSKGNAEIDPTRDISLLSAFAYAQLGDKEKAVEYLKIYFAVNDRLRAGFANDPGWQFRSLVDDPGFRRAVGSQ